MAKKRRNSITIDNKQLIAIAILILSLIIYFHLFFIGEILFKLISTFIGNPFFILILIDAYLILTMLKLEKLILITEMIGIALIYLSMSLIVDKSYLFNSVSNIIGVIITPNLAQILYFILFVIGVVFCLVRFKNVILRELNIKIKETNSTIQVYKNRIDEQKELKFEELSKNNIQLYNYISTFLEQQNEPISPLIKNINKNYISEYANSIYQYVDDLKTALIKIHALNEQEIIFTNEELTIENIKIVYYTKDLLNKKIIINKINGVIKNSSLATVGNEWTLVVKYQSNILISLKDMITNYYDYKTATIGISNLGKLVNLKMYENLFINYENLRTMSKFLENLFLQKSLANEKFIIIDFKKEILTNYVNKENVLYEVITSNKILYSLLKYIENDIIEKQTYIQDLGYDSYLNFIKHKNQEYEVVNVIFHEITSISLVNNKLYDKILKLSKISAQYGYNFIFTNSKDNREVFNSKLYINTKQKLFFETFSNSFSKSLVKSKILKNINNRFIFYIQRNEKFQKVYFPGQDLQSEYINNLIGESLQKDNFKQIMLNNLWILEELKTKKLKNEIITTTYIMTKYNLDIKTANYMIDKLNKMR